ncbi:hypothetical protein V6Z11_A09G055500 [Gossypium hirsutum]
MDFSLPPSLCTASPKFPLHRWSFAQPSSLVLGLTYFLIQSIFRLRFRCSTA